LVLLAVYQAFYFFKQLIWVVGSWLDANLVRNYLRAFGDAGKRALGKASTGDAAFANSSDQSMTPMPDTDLSGTARASRVLKYYLTGRQVFSQFTYASLSLDLSRVGGKSRMLLAMALPTGQAMWLAPQAARVQNLHPRGLVST